MSEYVKDPDHPKSNAAGWRTISYDESGEVRRGATSEEGAPLTADGMDEGGGGESEGGEEGPDES